MNQRTVASVAWTGHFESHELNIERIAPAIRYVCLAEGGISHSVVSRYRRLCNILRIYFMVWSIGVAGFLAGCSGGSSGQNSQTPTTYKIGGSVSGLSGSGLVLQDNGGDNLPVTGNGTFLFATALASGAGYNVTVLTQPSNPAQTCTVASGSGTPSANVTSVQVTCAATTYTIGGTVSGLVGTGLALQDNGGDSLTITGNGSFTFKTAINGGSAYNISVLSQPSNPAQTCTVANGSGTVSANVTNVQVSCSTVFGNTIGGTVSGLVGTGLVLQDNGGDNLSITADGTFTFVTGITSGRTYAVTILTQVSAPAQNCTVTNGNGTANANITNVAVTCTYNAAPVWGWLAGSNTNNATGTYGTEGTGATGNSPGARNFSVGWTDLSGNLWLFGGTGRDSTGTPGLLNDLWKWSSGQWIWVSGANVAEQAGSYGTKGTGSSSNYPGARAAAVGWTDASGNFWLFGGNDGNSSIFNDLWKRSGSQWTWVSGSSGFNTIGTYGTEGTAAAANAPGARTAAATWTDASGNLWLFGGSGYDSVGTLISGSLPTLNDLWKFATTTSQWTWVGGANLGARSGTYGTMGTAAASNMPGARSSPCHWTDKAGNFWLFGGLGYDSAGTSGFLNDLWEYNPNTGQWTWVNGPNLANQPSVYGTEGTPASTNSPGARAQAACWIDPAGNFWVFGGNGTVTPSNASINLFDDLWEYSAGQWTWVGGSNMAGQPGTHGTLGTFAAGNLPDARYPAAYWTDALGDLWMFGGFAEYQTHTASNMNDMWEYVP